MCLIGAKNLCSMVGAWDCTNVDNECSGNNIAGRISGACSTDAHCQDFAKSSYALCCDAVDAMQDLATKWVCDNVSTSRSTKTVERPHLPTCHAFRFFTLLLRVLLRLFLRPSLCSLHLMMRSNSTCFILVLSLGDRRTLVLQLQV